MKLSERAYLKVSAAMPPALAARLDLARPASLAGPPLNGQRERQRLVRDLLAAVRFDQVVETGTFRGATTLFLSQVSGLPTFSVELLPRFFRFAGWRCGQDPSVHLTLGDSRAFLRDLAAGAAGRTTLFYLDAHWQPDVPRFEELEIIAAGWPRAVVIVDDFAVPDDPGYGFTSYDGTALTLDYLPALPGWARYYPAARSGSETGARRGCLVLAAPEVAAPVEDVRSLRPAVR
jgi:predicted O-methyltransferase YrrM